MRLETEVKNGKNQTYWYFSWMLISNQSYIFHSLLCKRLKKSLVKHLRLMLLLPYFSTTEERECVVVKATKANSGKAVFKWDSTVTIKTSPLTDDPLLFNPKWQVLHARCLGLVENVKGHSLLPPPHLIFCPLKQTFNLINLWHQITPPKLMTKYPVLFLRDPRKGSCQQLLES